MGLKNKKLASTQLSFLDIKRYCCESLESKITLPSIPYAYACRDMRYIGKGIAVKQGRKGNDGRC